MGDALARLCMAAPGFYIKTQQRLGVGRAQIEAPTGKFHTWAVGGVGTNGRGGALKLVFGLKDTCEDTCLCFVHSEVGFAATGEGGHALIHRFRQWIAGDAHQFGDRKPRGHTAVAAGKVSKTMTGAHLVATSTRRAFRGWTQAQPMRQAIISSFIFSPGSPRISQVWKPLNSDMPLARKYHRISQCRLRQGNSRTESQ